MSTLDGKRSKLVGKIISRQQKSPLPSREFVLNMLVRTRDFGTATIQCEYFIQILKVKNEA